MKKLIGLIIACVFSLTAMAQDYQNSKTTKPDQVTVKYCAMLKDGKTMMMKDNKDLIVDVTLANGTKIKTDGTVIKSDGTQTTLKNGECVDYNGNIMNPKNGDKVKIEDDQKMPPPK